jgi:hypothetical protein
MRASAALLTLFLGVSIPAMAGAQCVPLKIDLWEAACYTSNEDRTDGAFATAIGPDSSDNEPRHEIDLQLDITSAKSSPIPGTALAVGPVAVMPETACIPLAVDYWAETCFGSTSFTRLYLGSDLMLPLDAPVAVSASASEGPPARGKAPGDPFPNDEPPPPLGPPPVEGLRLGEAPRSLETRKRLDASSESTSGSSRLTQPRPGSS